MRAKTIHVIDVAEYLLAKDGSDMEFQKLHVLCYLCQGWSLAASGSPMFSERIVAADSGPVVPALQALDHGNAVHHGSLYARARSRRALSSRPRGHRGGAS